MDWGFENAAGASVGDGEMTKSWLVASAQGRGLVGWMFDLIRTSRGQRDGQQKKLRLVETLALGGKRQLMLVTCGGESFLVGGGLDSVETIVRLTANFSGDDAEKNRDELCQ